MPHVARRSLAALALCLAYGIPLGIPAASAQPASSGSTWTDPPARKLDAGKPEAEKPAAEAPRAASPEPSPAPTLAATAKTGGPASHPAAVSRTRDRPAAVARRAVPAPKRLAAAPRRTRIATAPRVRAERPPRIAAAAPAPRAPRDEAFTGFRPYGSGIGYGLGDADDRLERLRAAEAAGFLVVRRRSVEFPDGRSLRTYRPLEDGDGF